MDVRMDAAAPAATLVECATATPGFVAFSEILSDPRVQAVSICHVI